MYFENYRILFSIFILNNAKYHVRGFSWRSTVKENLCELPTCAHRRSDFLHDHCNVNDTSGATVRGRCCVDKSNVTIGLDLGNCSLRSMVSLNTLVDIVWLNLAENSFEKSKCNSSSYFGDAFEGLTRLEQVYVDNGCVCPGGNLLWNNTGPSGREIRLCEVQRSTCKYLNETCPTHALCSSNGPGFFHCTCEEGWFGYRCLVKHGISLALILGCIAGGMVLITVVLFAVQMRRKKMHAQGYYWIEGTANRSAPRS